MIKGDAVVVVGCMGPAAQSSGRCRRLEAAGTLMLGIGVGTVAVQQQRTSTMKDAGHLLLCVLSLVIARSTKTTLV